MGAKKREFIPLIKTHTLKNTIFRAKKNLLKKSFFNSLLRHTPKKIQFLEGKKIL